MRILRTRLLVRNHGNQLKYFDNQNFDLPWYTLINHWIIYCNRDGSQGAPTKQSSHPLFWSLFKGRVFCRGAPTKKKRVVVVIISSSSQAWHCFQLTASWSAFGWQWLGTWRLVDNMQSVGLLETFLEDFFLGWSTYTPNAQGLNTVSPCSRGGYVRGVGLTSHRFWVWIRERT